MGCFLCLLYSVSFQISSHFNWTGATRNLSAAAFRYLEGSVYAAVSSGPFDNDEERHGGLGMFRAVEIVNQILAEVLLEKDPTLQQKIDRILMSESALASNVVTAASIACCKAGAKLRLTPLSDHIGVMCNKPEGLIPSIAFSIINGGHPSASSLWVQVTRCTRTSTTYKIKIAIDGTTA